jgi:hypothetical protein
VVDLKVPPALQNARGGTVGHEGQQQKPADLDAACRRLKSPARESIFPPIRNHPGFAGGVTTVCAPTATGLQTHVVVATREQQQ